MHDPGILDSAGDGLLRWGGAFKRHHGALGDHATESREVFGVCGAACLMPKSVFDELKGFDEDFFASHEDVDLLVSRTAAAAIAAGTSRTPS